MLINRKIQLPTLEEDAAINLGISLDPDTMEVSDTEFPNLKPFRGHPTNQGKRVSSAIRLDTEEVAAFPA